MFLTDDFCVHPHSHEYSPNVKISFIKEIKRLVNQICVVIIFLQIQLGFVMCLPPMFEESAFRGQRANQYVCIGRNDWDVRKFPVFAT